MQFRKLVGDRAFYKMALTVAVPMMIQNFITNLVSMLDNLMVGAVGTEEMSAVSIVNQLIFVFNLAVFGALSGAGIFTAQFHGKNDVDGIRYTFRYKAAIGVVLFVVAVAALVAFDRQLIGLFLHETKAQGDLEATMAFSRRYLSIIIFGLLPFVVSQVFSSTLRETGETLAPMYVGLAAVVTNVVFNYLLIFGKLGFPEMGVGGAAIATVISRYVECFIIVVYTVARRKRFVFVRGAFKSLYIPKRLVSLITVKGGLPLLVNEFLWAMGMSLLSVGYSLHGLPVVAGYSISSTVMNLFNIAFITLGASIGIIVGKQLGAGEFEKAIDSDRKLIAFSVAVSVVIGVFVFFAGGEIPRLYNTTEESKRFASYFIRVCACAIPINAFANASYFTLRSGGRALVTFLFDSVFVMVVSVPTVFILHYAFHLSIWVIFPIVQSIELIKCVIGFILIRKRIWVNNIVDRC